jgi:hypothetical protein
MALERLAQSPSCNVYARGTHLEIFNLGKRTPKAATNFYEVYSKGGDALGAVAWFPRWRKYVFEPEARTVFEETCMREISQFIEEETAAQRADAGRRKAAIKP